MHNPAAAAAAAAAAIMHDPSSAVAAYSPYHPHHHPHHHSHHHPHPHHHAHQQHAYYRVAGTASPATVSGIKEFGGGLNQIPTPDGPTPGSTGTASHLHGGHHPNTLTSPHGLSSQHHHPASTIASTTANNLGIDPSHAHSHHSHQPQPQQQQQHHQPNVHHPNHPGHHHHHNHHPSLSSSPVSTATAAQAAAVQTRILEMRKEKSRDAARSRRGKENHEFYELAKMLPLPSAITSQLDKASIIRLTISYLKLREFSQNGDPSWNSALSSMSALKSKANSVFENHQGTHILQSLDGFAFALGQDGRFLYISETVSIYLGLSQVEMTGSSIFDYTHQQDHAELAEQLGLSHAAANNSSIPHHHHQHHHHAHLHHQHSNSPLPPASVSSSASNDDSDNGNHYSNGHSLMTSTGVNDTFERQFCIRMKSTLTKRGCQHYKSSGYRVVNIVAHLRAEMLRRNNNSGQINGGTDPSKIIGLVALAIALPPPSINELRLEPDMFVTRHSLDFKIIHCEQRVTDLLNYSPDELIGRNFYSLIHGQDVSLMKKCHIDLINKGQSMSGYYRIVNKSGGYTWMQTCATLICNNPTASNGGQSKASNNVNSNGGASTPTNLAGSSTPVGTPVPPPTSQEDQDQSVICVNYVLSAIEYTGVIMDVCQIGHSNTKLLNTGHGSTAKIRSSSVHVKKSHSSTPSPEILGGSKMNNNNNNNNSSNNSSLRSIANSNHNSNNVDMTVTGQRPVPGPNETQSHLPTSHRHSPRLLSLPQPPPSSSSSRSTSSPMETRSENVKRRRMNSSPVRPWKSPSPPPPPNNNSIGPNSESNAGTHGTASSPNLLRHISVIRETPPILKPQAMAPSPYHAHHYHHLVDQYAAAYHLYKTGPNGGPISPQNSTNSIANPNVSPHHPTPHHWSAYG